MDIELKKLQTLKVSRPVDSPIFMEYTELDPESGARMSVKGNPNSC